MRKILLFAITVIASASAFAEKWEALLTLPGLSISVDRDSVKNTSAGILGWQKWSYDEDRVFESYRYRSGKYLIYSNCLKGTRANAGFTLLDENGNAVLIRNAETFAFAPPPVGTIPYKIHQLICQPAQPSLRPAEP